MPLFLLTAAPAFRLWFALVPLFLSLCALCFDSEALTPLPRPLVPPFCPSLLASSFFGPCLSCPLPRCLRFTKDLSTWPSCDFAMLSFWVGSSSFSPSSSSSSSEGSGEPPKTRGVVKGLWRSTKVITDDETQPLVYIYKKHVWTTLSMFLDSNNLFTVYYFPLRWSRSMAYRYGWSSWFQMYWETMILRNLGLFL